jgi:hypothetical protein
MRALDNEGLGDRTEMPFSPAGRRDRPARAGRSPIQGHAVHAPAAGSAVDAR